MRRVNLSLATLLAISTFAIAGGNVAPIETEVAPITTEVEVAPVENNGFYIGIAYGYSNVQLDNSLTGNKVDDYDYGSILLDIGYKINPYISIEGRYWAGINSNNDLAWKNHIDSDVTVDAWGIYAKPTYPVSDKFDIYALVGYGSGDASYDIPNAGTIDSENSEGFSWGLGAEYQMSNNVALFIDYTSVIDGESTKTGLLATDNSVETINFGVNYKF